jgi:3-hydroxyacyl-CoA dehydrogenase/enoyl-CoA hydratase/3-hydroxybutyryl-CoA epimerase
MSDFTQTLDADGLATITWDCQARPMNVMSKQGFADLNALIDGCLTDPMVKGVIITSAKSDFAAGMDLAVIAETKDMHPENPAQGCFEMVMEIHQILRKIELAGMDFKTKKGGKPIVAVLPGTALGIGLEIPLACHHIICADKPKGENWPARNQGGYFPRRRRHNTLGAQNGGDGGKPLSVAGQALLTV